MQVRAAWGRKSYNYLVKKARDEDGLPAKICGNYSLISSRLFTQKKYLYKILIAKHILEDVNTTMLPKPQLT